MLVSKGGGVVVFAAPANTRHMAWKNARRELGAFKVLQLKRAGYTAQRVIINTGEQVWQSKSTES